MHKKRTAEFRERNILMNSGIPSLVEDKFDIDRGVSEEIRRQIENGADWYDLMSYSYKGLSRTLSFYKINGRSKLNTKEEMVDKLLDVFSPSEKSKSKQHVDPTLEALKVMSLLDRD